MKKALLGILALTTAALSVGVCAANDNPLNKPEYVLQTFQNAIATENLDVFYSVTGKDIQDLVPDHYSLRVIHSELSKIEEEEGGFTTQWQDATQERYTANHVYFTEIVARLIGKKSGKRRATATLRKYEVYKGTFKLKTFNYYY